MMAACTRPATCHIRVTLSLLPSARGSAQWPQWVEMRHSRFVRSGEVHPSKAVIDDPKPQHPTLGLIQLCR
jgi:hypothetical protein